MDMHCIIITLYLNFISIKLIKIITLTIITDSQKSRMIKKSIINAINSNSDRI